MTWIPQKLQLDGDDSRASLQQSRPVSRRQPPGVQQLSDLSEKSVRQWGCVFHLNLQVDGVVQLFVAHISYLAFASSPPGPPAPLSIPAAALASLPPNVDCSGREPVESAFHPAKGRPSRPTHQTARAPAQRFRCLALATKCA